jgi:hypothetical protein
MDLVAMPRTQDVPGPEQLGDRSGLEAQLAGHDPLEHEEPEQTLAPAHRHRPRAGRQLLDLDDEVAAGGGARLRVQSLAEVGISVEQVHRAAA